MRNYPRSGYRLAVAAFAAAAATLIAGDSRADFDLGQGIVLAPSAQIPQPPGVTSDPITLTVYCGAGGTVAQAVSFKPLTTSRLTITISGTCTEAVDNVPGGVTLQAASSGDGLQAPSASTDPVLGISGTGVTLNGLTISGGVTGLRGRSGSAFTGNNLVIQGTSNTNVLMNHAVATLNNPTIQNSANDGIEAYWGSTVFLDGGMVQSNAHDGIEGYYDASVEVFGGAVLQNNGADGAVAANGGLVSDGIVKNNAAGTGGTAGLQAGTGGHILVSGSNTVVTGNAVTGILVIRGASERAGRRHRREQYRKWHSDLRRRQRRRAAGRDHTKQHRQRDLSRKRRCDGGRRTGASNHPGQRAKRHLHADQQRREIQQLRQSNHQQHQLGHLMRRVPGEPADLRHGRQRVRQRLGADRLQDFPYPGGAALDGRAGRGLNGPKVAASFRGHSTAE